MLCFGYVFTVRYSTIYFILQRSLTVWMSMHVYPVLDRFKMDGGCASTEREAMVWETVDIYCWFTYTGSCNNSQRLTQTCCSVGKMYIHRDLLTCTIGEPRICISRYQEHVTYIYLADRLEHHRLMTKLIQNHNPTYSYNQLRDSFWLAILGIWTYLSTVMAFNIHFHTCAVYTIKQLYVSSGNEYVNCSLRV